MSCTLPGNGWGRGAFKKARHFFLQVLLLLASVRSFRALFLSLIAVFRRIHYVVFVYCLTSALRTPVRCRYSCVCVRACVSLHVCMHACTDTGLSVCLFVCMYVCMYVRMSVHVCMNVRLYVCMHVPLFASYMFLCMHTAMCVSFVMQPFRLSSCGIGFRV